MNRKKVSTLKRVILASTKNEATESYTYIM
jgi:hypothetical protein